MELNTLVSLIRMKFLDMENIIGMMVRFIRDIGLIARLMVNSYFLIIMNKVKEKQYGLTGKDIWVYIKMIRNTVGVFSNGRMEGFSKVNGLMVNNMDLDS
jgi:hypothetical protein